MNHTFLSGSALASLQPTCDCPDFVINLLRNAMNYELARPLLLAAYKIGTKPMDQSADRRKILMRLASL